MHMDLFGPTKTLSLGGKKYGSRIVDDYSRYIGIYFLAHKHEAFKVFEIFYKRFENEKGFVSLLSDVTMGLNLRILSSDHYMKGMVFSTTYLHREHLKKMG